MACSSGSPRRDRRARPRLRRHLPAGRRPPQRGDGAGGARPRRRAGRDVEEALAAYAAGFEAMGALARAAHPALYDGGWHPTAVCGSFGRRGGGFAAAGARRHRRAIGARRWRCCGPRGCARPSAPPARAFRSGWRRAAGVAAARLAAAGAEVDLETVATRLSPASRPPSARLSGPAAREQRRRSRRTGSRPTPAACRRTARSRPRRSSAEAVRAGGGRIGVRVHPLSLQAAPIEAPADGLEAKFSIPYLTAYTLLHGAPGLDSFAAVEPRRRPARARGSRCAADPRARRLGGRAGGRRRGGWRGSRRRAARRGGRSIGPGWRRSGARWRASGWMAPWTTRIAPSRSWSS